MIISTPPNSVENLVELLRWRADQTPSERGFRFLENGEGWGERLSFADLDRRARAIAARIGREIEPGERVLLLYPPSLAYIEAFFGCLYAGAIAVPAYPPNPRRLERTLPRLQSIVEDSGATLAITTAAISGMAQALGTQAAGLAALDWIATDEISTDLKEQWRPSVIDADDVAFLQYTSGSTGMPKGVKLDHSTLLRNEAMIQQAFGTAGDEVGVSWLPLYHDMGLIGAVIQPVYSGLMSVLMSPLDFLKRPTRWVEAIDRFGGTMSTGPNFGYDLTVRKTPPKVRDSLDLSTWRVACNGAEPVRVGTLERFADYFGPCGFDRGAFMPAYGLAEVGLIVSSAPCGRDPKVIEVEGRGQVSCGPLMGDFDIRIVDPQTREVLDEGEVGEIWLRRGSVAPGYWQKEEVNAEVFEAMGADGEGPFLRTGDLGLVSDGELVITGRLKDLIVIRGVNHYPQDIEATVETVDPKVRRGCGAAFSIDVDDEEELVVVQEVKSDELDDALGLVRRIREAITTVHRVVPHDIVLIEPRTIEKTSSGKIQRFAVRRSYQEGSLDVVSVEQKIADGQQTKTPATRETIGDDRRRREVEAWLVEKVADESGLEATDVDLDAPFSAFGIGSAEAVGIVGELEEQLGESIAATALYDFPTIAALAGHLSGDQEEAVSSPSRRSSAANGATDEEAVAIVGMACQFPGADGIDAYWDLIKSGAVTIDEVPEDRWEPGTFTDPDQAGFDTMATDRGGFLDNIDGFDARFFGISAREARAMDPQQRLMLETGWHAIEDAGMTTDDLAGSATGVFVGQSGSDFARIYQGAPVRAGSGMSPAITANRLSYWLNLRGPSVVVDTACSSSLTALDQAMMNLRLRRCDAAIVGGVNAILAPDMSVAFSQARMLSPRGQCCAFDESADGYVRGEGSGVVIVKRLDDALRDGDQIRAVIRGTAINQDGQTNGLTAPSGPAQRQVIEAALADAGVSPESIGAIEAHGTGTELGDAIEARALNKIFGAQTEPSETARWLGSVKTQIGHLEAASGMAGLIKAALMVERGEVGPLANFDTPNPVCELDKSPFSIPNQVHRWPGTGDGTDVPRRVGVSSFGFGGTNAHVVIEEPPRTRWVEGAKNSRPGLLCLSASDEERLQALAKVVVDDEDIWSRDLRDLGWTMGTQREMGALRYAVAGSDPVTVRKRLQDEIVDAGPETLGPKSGTEKVSVGFAFAGQGEQWPGMGLELRHQSTVFRRHFEEAIAALEAAGCRQLVERIDSEEFVASSPFGQPALFAIEVALARTLMDWGIVADVVMGHGVGEIAAAHISGALSLKDGASLAVARGRAIEAGHDGLGDEWSPGNRRRRRQVLFCSAIEGRLLEDDEILDADYWHRQLGERPRFEDAVDAVSEAGVDVVVEIGAGNQWSEMGRRSSLGQSMHWVDVPGQQGDGLERLMDVAGQLWTRGVDVMPGAVNGGGKRIEVAKTPFLRQSYWPDKDDLRRIKAGDT